MININSHIYDCGAQEELSAYEDADTQREALQARLEGLAAENRDLTAALDDARAQVPYVTPSLPACRARGTPRARPPRCPHPLLSPFGVSPAAMHRQREVRSDLQRLPLRPRGTL